MTPEGATGILIGFMLGPILLFKRGKMEKESIDKSQKTLASKLNRARNEKQALEHFLSKIRKIHTWNSASHIVNGAISETGKKLDTVNWEIEQLCKSADIPAIVCPHCGYDGEFDIAQPQFCGFRMLEIILEPRQVMALDPEKKRIGLSDPLESYDPFDTISDPDFAEYLDDASLDKSYRDVRNFARGRRILLCGKCQGYFDGSIYAELCSTEYNVTVRGGNPWTDK